MAKQIGKIAKMQPEQPKARFKYACPACTKVAIKTSNKMLDVSVNCENCGKLVKLDNANNYTKI